MFLPCGFFFCFRAVVRCSLRLRHRPFSTKKVRAYMGHVQDNAEEAVRRVIDQLPADRNLSFTYAMDSGGSIGADGTADGNPSISIKVGGGQPRAFAFACLYGSWLH